MKVIFIKDLRGQGKTGDVKEVKDGYGTNFLIKNGYAVMATLDNLRNLEKSNNEKAIQENLLVKDMLDLKKELEQKVFTFKVKTGEFDRVFGTISSKQIAKELENQGYKIDKKKIKIESDLSTLGVHEVGVELHKQVMAKIRVKLVK